MSNLSKHISTLTSVLIIPGWDKQSLRWARRTGAHNRWDRWYRCLRGYGSSCI